MRTLVLWDIDHTLIDAGEVSKGIYAKAFQRITGRVLEQVADMAGRTEWEIMAETLSLHGVEADDELLKKFGAALAAEFTASEPGIRAQGRPLPGARDVLAELVTRPEVVQSVLTGNMEPIAISKLTIFELAEYVDFSVGAYGLDHSDRAELVHLARERATNSYGETFTPANTVLVGDTPNDVRAGHEGGARVVAVATGSSDRSALRQAGAEDVLDDLTDVPAAVRAILGTATSHGDLG
ncbi:MAG TPA: HAD hydrolase-like protein [Actinoallomurus sp.]|jgi:phosphoglycolate phosphatase-like HAD superfamily hydrolase